MTVFCQAITRKNTAAELSGASISAGQGSPGCTPRHGSQTVGALLCRADSGRGGPVLPPAWPECNQAPSLLQGETMGSKTVSRALPTPRRFKLTLVDFLFHTAVTVIAIVIIAYHALTLCPARLQVSAVLCSYLTLA